MRIAACRVNRLFLAEKSYEIYQALDTIAPFVWRRSLDFTALAAGHAYFRMGAFDVSPDHRLLAFSSDTSGAESFTLFLKDLATGPLLAETIERPSPSVSRSSRKSRLNFVSAAPAPRGSAASSANKM